MTRSGGVRVRLWLWVAVLCAAGCATVHPPSPSAAERLPPPTLATELREAVEKLAGEIGERNCYRPARLEAAAAWIERELSRARWQPRRLPVHVPEGPPFHCGPMTVWNIEAEKRGTTRPADVLVIGAHYDTKVATRHWTGWGKPLTDRPGTPGADDNASGVATLLALARMLADQPTDCTIRFVAFVNEERPFFQTESMGSRVYARQVRRKTNETVIGMIALETMGVYSRQAQRKRFWLAGLFGLPARPDYVAFLSDHRSARFARKCAEHFRRHSSVTVRTVSLLKVGSLVAWSDDWSFGQEGIPSFAVTDTAFLRHDHYHELSDTPERLDYETMAWVVAGLAGVICELAGASAP